MKKILSAFILIVLQTPLYPQKNILPMQCIKSEGNFSLIPDFFKTITAYSQATVFVETGTFEGDTSRIASGYFQEVHTIELMQDRYEQNKEIFKQYPNIHAYQGSSPETLMTILPALKQKKIVFWLDAHGHGTPIFEELQAIKTVGINNGIILIDDMRLFDNIAFWSITTPYVSDIKKGILAINPDYCVEILGDILIAHLNSEPFKASPVLHACTISRLFPQEYSIKNVLAAERKIVNAPEDERIAIDQWYSKFGTKHLLLWHGLICMGRKDYSQAYDALSNTEKEFNHWRIQFYLAKAAMLNKQTNRAHQHLQKALAMVDNNDDRNLLNNLIKKLGIKQR